MNILIVNGSSDLYGSSRILSIIIEELSFKNNVHLLLPENGPLVDLLKEKKLKVNIFFLTDMPIIARRFNSIPGLYFTLVNFIKTYFYIKQFVQKHNITIGYANTSACLFMLLIFKWTNLKTILHFHEILETPRRVVSVLNNWAVNWPDHIISVSNAVKNNLIKFEKDVNTQNKVEVIYNGIEDIKKDIFKNTNKTLVTLIGRITEAKGIWFFLNAIDILESDVANNCIFKIVGGSAPGKEYLIEKLRNDIKHHKYGPCIQHYDFVTDVSNYLNETDILVVPSLMADPFPTTILEGLCAGKPVIASNAGGATESLEDGISGILIERNNSKQFSDALSKLIKDQALSNNFGKAARKRYEENFNVSIFIKKMNTFLERVNEE